MHFQITSRYNTHRNHRRAILLCSQSVYAFKRFSVVSTMTLIHYCPSLSCCRRHSMDRLKQLFWGTEVQMVSSSSTFFVARRWRAKVTNRSSHKFITIGFVCSSSSWIKSLCRFASSKAEGLSLAFPSSFYWRTNCGPSLFFIATTFILHHFGQLYFSRISTIWLIHFICVFIHDDVIIKMMLGTHLPPSEGIPCDNSLSAWWLMDNNNNNNNNKMMMMINNTSR